MRTKPYSCCNQHKSRPMPIPKTAPMKEIILPSKRNTRAICLSVAPRLRKVTTSSFLSIISIDSEPTILKHATMRMKVRKM